MPRENKYTYNVGYRAKSDKESLEQYYKRIAKQADQRLRALESYKHDKGFAGIEKYAYAIAMSDIKKYGGGKRFDTAAPASKKSLERKIEDIEKFLGSPTSTKRGVISVYKKRADTLNKNLGLKGKDALSWEDLYAYWEQVGEGKFNYDAVEFRAMVALRNAQIKAQKSLVEEIKNTAAKNVRVTEDQVLNLKIKRMVANGIDPSDYFGNWKESYQYNNK